MDLAVLADNCVKIKENEKIEKYLNLARELKKAVEHASRVMVMSVEFDALGTVSKSLETGLEQLEIGGRIETIQNTAVEIGQNTEKNPRDLRRLAVTQNLGKANKLTLLR